jgi:hypothetical protein
MRILNDPEISSRKNRGPPDIAPGLDIAGQAQADHRDPADIPQIPFRA